MSYTMLQTKTLTEMALRLKGTLFSLRNLQTSKLAGAEETFDTLNGKTLVFTVPSVTVTFATVDPISLSDALGEINTQVQAVDSNFLVGVVNSNITPSDGKRLRLYTSTPEGLEIDLAASTGASRLGFGTSGTLSGFPVDSSRFVGGGDTFSGGVYIILNGEGAVRQHFSAHSSGAEVTAILLARSGELVEAVVINRSASLVYFQLHDRATALSGGEVPKISIPMEVDDRLSLSPTAAYPFDTGIVFGFSSTQDTYTADGTGGTVYSTVAF